MAACCGKEQNDLAVLVMKSRWSSASD